MQRANTVPTEVEISSSNLRLLTFILTFLYIKKKIVYLSRGVRGMFFHIDFSKVLSANKESRETRVGRRRKRLSPLPLTPLLKFKKNKCSRQVHSPEGLTFFLCSLSMRPLL